MTDTPTGTAELVKRLENHGHTEELEAIAVIKRLERERDGWIENFQALSHAIVGDTGLSAITEAKRLRDALEAAERERDRWRENAQTHDDQAQKYSRRAWDAEAALEEAERVIAECSTYIRSPLRMSDDTAEETRRDGIVGRADDYLARHATGTRNGGDE